MLKKITLLALVMFCCACQPDQDYIMIDDLNSLDDDLNLLLENASNGQGSSYFLLPASTDFASIPQDPKNPITKEKVELGRLLLHDPATGGNPLDPNNAQTYSCASCHAAASGFSSGTIQGIGEGGVGFGTYGEGRRVSPSIDPEMIDVQPLRSPSLLNLAYQELMLWNGQFGATGANKEVASRTATIPENNLGYQGVETQAIKGQEVHRLRIDKEFITSYDYKNLFDEAFPGISKEKRYNKLTAGLAIAAYERTLLANRAPWQEYLKGDKNALTNKEKRGAKVFFDKGKCYQCHNGPALKDQNFYALGMADFQSTYGNIILQGNMDLQTTGLGRGGFTKIDEDNYKFKTPTLYNLADNPVYGHGGSFTSIKEVIEYKNTGVAQNSKVPSHQLAPQFGNLNLTTTEIEELTAFITNGLRDPDLKRYEPQAVNSGLCFPNNDSASRQDQGCD